MVKTVKNIVFWSYLHYFSTIFHVLGLILIRKPVGQRVRVATGAAASSRRDTRGLPVHFPIWLCCWLVTASERLVLQRRCHSFIPVYHYSVQPVVMYSLEHFQQCLPKQKSHLPPLSNTSNPMLAPQSLLPISPGIVQSPHLLLLVVALMVLLCRACVHLLECGGGHHLPHGSIDRLVLSLGHVIR